jgi:hypothetical protein
MDAAETQILEVVRAAVLSTDDMINLMGQRGCSGRKPAILANVGRPTTNEFTGLGGNGHDAVRKVDRSSAWSLSRLRVSFSRTISAYSIRSSGVRVPAALL